MKTIKKNVLVVAFMLGTLFSYANNENNFISGLVKLDAKKVKVVFNGVKKRNYLTIKDENGNQLHSEKISRQGRFSKVFNFKNLIDGNYSIELNKNSYIIIKPFKVNKNEVLFLDDNIKIINKPSIEDEKGVLKISRISSNKSPLEATLFYNDEVIHSETITSESIINKTYKLDKTITGSYKVIVKSDNRTYEHNFKI